ncbi:LOW QUALITY PROTEIN: crocetin glucosyltransferase, chloroplastic-like [Dioscorea cayenensis subsp. rotundata]|uniref:Glycosyltransferase n=1 Tax=Dioscorea cayennensis subsp. rotundata TaxID=55577 RepID=A0AB40CXW4_DIOCR|nr:LOW QUALITY PROTEIN: crocetin glucosyltransferase, chloroplastic-like [Dioscorea cayenensis subsp. rotundata]
MADNPQPHFLFITYPLQSHINPALHLAKHLATTTGATVTFSTTIFAHRRMFSSTPNSDKGFNDGLITYLPFSDGFDKEGYKRATMDLKEYFSLFRSNSKRNVSILLNDLATCGRPVTCVVYTILLSWVVDIAGEQGISSVLYWIQAASVFAIYYHFFHGFESLIKAHADDPSFPVCFPGLLPLQIKDLPSFLTVRETDGLNADILDSLRELFRILDREQEKMKSMGVDKHLSEMGTDALASVSNEVEAIPVGHLPKEYTNSVAGYLFREDEKKYMKWLDTKEEGSVVYISFGSVSVMKKEQMQEIVKALKESKRPYLWVVRKDNREEELLEIEEGEDGMVVEWCSQVKVLAHRAVGCFVTHCGWNSTLESLVCGVPMVGVPHWTDQAMNAKLVESLWGCGVRSEVDGVIKGEELVRGLELVMGEGEKSVDIRRKAKMQKDKAIEAVGEGGSSHLNLMALVGMFTG